MITKRLNELDEKDQKAAIEILEATTQVLAASILSGIKPGQICSMATLLLEYALINSNFDKEEAIKVIDQAAEHIKGAVRDEESAISTAAVSKRMKQIADETNEDEDNENGSHLH